MVNPIEGFGVYIRGGVFGGAHLATTRKDHPYFPLYSCSPGGRSVAMALLSLGTVPLVGLTTFAITTNVRMTELNQTVAKTSTPFERNGREES